MISAIGYYVFYGFAQFISILPFSCIYLFADLLYILLRITGYRSKIILNNLRNSFPEKSEKEIQKIRKEYLHFMADYILESIKGITISKEEISNRVRVSNIEILYHFKNINQSIIATAGHYGNWEMCGLGASLVIPQPLIGVYKPLTNVRFEKLMGKVRQKWGLELVPMWEVADSFEKSHNKRTTIHIMVGDQSPSDPNKAYWTRFLNQDTAYHYGIEKYARRYNYPVVFCKVNCIKRGHYHIEIIDLIPSPNEHNPNEITEICKNYLEQIIKDNPVPWLWSHNRWKHKKPTT